ncbi:hypothetical protein JCM19241_5983 [Vibrio ishigakensis]|uniref:Uncharacterized protein n=1 Tax=Vibrio ishigakensis TaxID=1481914 RepID=A0A0B8QJ58_9VIBR|nr:hypothetical protein JCM19241_5983 [Vibrio ishigakensis]
MGAWTASSITGNSYCFIGDNERYRCTYEERIEKIRGLMPILSKKVLSHHVNAISGTHGVSKKQVRRDLGVA